MLCYKKVKKKKLHDFFSNNTEGAINTKIINHWKCVVLRDKL